MGSLGHRQIFPHEKHGQFIIAIGNKLRIATTCTTAAALAWT
jgi:hypothetical protein